MNAAWFGASGRSERRCSTLAGWYPPCSGRRQQCEGRGSRRSFDAAGGQACRGPHPRGGPGYSRLPHLGRRAAPFDISSSAASLRFSKARSRSSAGRVDGEQSRFCHRRRSTCDPDMRTAQPPCRNRCEACPGLPRVGAFPKQRDRLAWFFHCLQHQRAGRRQFRLPRKRFPAVGRVHL